MNYVTTDILPLEDELDENHDEHRHEYDQAGKNHECSWEGLDTCVVDDGVERVGEEVDEAGDEGEAGENSPHFVTVHRLTE